jgi:hypothetical protein
MPKYPMDIKITEIMNIASLFWIPKASPIATIPINPKISATPTLLASFLDIVVPLAKLKAQRLDHLPPIVGNLSLLRGITSRDNYGLRFNCSRTWSTYR